MSKKNLSIIDADSLLYSNGWICRESDNFAYHKAELRKAFMRIPSTCDSNEYIGLLTIGKNFRYEVATTKPYKGNRKGAEKPKFFYDARKYMIEKLGCTFYEDLEADDLCKIAAYKYKDKYNIYIASPDKDLKQFPGIFYNYVKEKKEIIDYEQALYNLWTQVLTGDTADNILGLRGVGPVGAASLLKDVSAAKYGETVFKAYTDTLGLSEGLQSLTENFRLIYLLGDYDFGDSEPFNIVEIKHEVEW